MRRDALLDGNGYRLAIINCVADRQLIEIRVVEPVIHWNQQRAVLERNIILVHANRRIRLLSQKRFRLLAQICIENRAPFAIAGCLAGRMTLPELRNAVRDIEHVINAAPDCTTERAVRCKHVLPGNLQALAPGIADVSVALEFVEIVARDMHILIVKHRRRAAAKVACYGRIMDAVDVEINGLPVTGIAEDDRA